MKICIKLPNGYMNVDLEKFYPTTQHKSKKLMSVIKKYEYLNADSVEQIHNYFIEKISLWEKLAETATLKMACYKCDSSKFKQYEQEFNLCKKNVRLYKSSLRVLTEGK